MPNLGNFIPILGRCKASLCHELRDEKGLTLAHPYNDGRIMAGQGSIGMELLRQQPNVGRVLCPIGGGGLISGLGLAIKAQRPVPVTPVCPA